MEWDVLDRSRELSFGSGLFSDSELILGHFPSSAFARKRWPKDTRGIPRNKNESCGAQDRLPAAVRWHALRRTASQEAPNPKATADKTMAGGAHGRAAMVGRHALAIHGTTEV